MKQHHIFVFVLLVCSIALFVSQAQGTKTYRSEEFMLDKPSGLDHQQFNCNNITCWMSNDGLIVSQRVTGTAGLEWPKGSGKTADFCSGLWIIGKGPDGFLRSACSEFNSELCPGTIGADPEAPENRIYKINSDGTGDWNDWPFDLGAPALKAKDGSDSLDSYGNRIPRLYGDQTLWWVMNDADPEPHFNLFCAGPMELEIHVLAFGFDETGPLADMLFYEWMICNKSQMSYDSTYIGLWDDPDLGASTNDYVACDPALNLGYAYNTPYDEMYMGRPPAYGFKLLMGPHIGSATAPQQLHMTSYTYFYLGAPEPWSDPLFAPEAYNYLKGRGSDGTPRRDPEGNITVFPLNGDPVTGEGHLLGENEFSDYRFIVSSGPISLEPGDMQTIRAVKILAQGQNNLESVALLKKHAKLAQNFHDQFFHLADVGKPLVMLEFMDAQPGIQISWNDLTKVYPQNGLELLGYKLYQVIDGNLAELASFDVKDGITEIIEMVDDQEVILYSGDENGLATSTKVTVDKSTGEPLVYGYTYSYFLKAFIHNTTATGMDRVITNDMEAINYTYLPVGYEGAFYAKHSQHNGDGEVLVMITDPKLMNNHHYKLSFDGPIGKLNMKLVDVSTGHIIYHDVLNDVKFDSLGFRLIVHNRLGIKAWDWDGDRWVTGVNWGGGGFFGGLDIGLHFLGSTLPCEELVPIHVEFQDIASVDHDGYWSKGAVYRYDLDYSYAGIGDLPLAAFDVSDSLNPRKLNICFVEHDSLVSPNKLWDMGWNGVDYPDYIGAREYLFVMSSDYSEGDGYDDANNGTSADVLYGLWPAQRGNHPYLEAEFNMDIIPSLGLSDKDVFEFTASLLNIEKPRITNPEHFALLQNYPNPFNSQTTITYNIGKQTHVTIEIYNLWGQRIKTLVDEKKDIGIYTITWDAPSRPSGVYFIRLLTSGGYHQVIKTVLIK
ncbi:T9SS C-terminal target domain-containing protein [candidate division KSB1 bacterium]|nr:T9SS type A sorting domain-containing protein [candidate division KSB1 bacterium]RQW06003.1 MAG: T9SS C-terminal target domain-containing protein [candidate division KSB1 bacterium]